MKSNLEVRNELEFWIKRTYLGPFNLTEEGVQDKNEHISFPPSDMYTTGILYPQSISESTFEITDIPEEIEDDSIEESSIEYSEISKKREKNNIIEDNLEDDLRLTTEYYPSSIAISSIVKKGDIISLTISCGIYNQSTKEAQEKFNARFSRTPIEYSIQIDTNDFKTVEGSASDEKWIVEEAENILTISGPNNEVSIKIIRRFQSGLKKNEQVITVSIINCKKTTENIKSINNCIYQPTINIQNNSGFIAFPDNTKLEYLNEEEVELKFLYRKYLNYGLGHGCACEWKKDNDLVTEVYSSIIPSEKINGVNFSPEELEGVDEILYMKKLTDLESSFNKSELTNNLKNFVNVYADWIDKQIHVLEEENLQEKFKESASLIIEKCVRLKNRMLTGISLLSDENVLKAFLDANKAMFMQRVFGDFSKHRMITGRNIPSKNNSTNDSLPEINKIPYNASAGSLWKDGVLSINNQREKGWALAKWRPFQLAFLLSQLEGIVNPNSNDRDTVDLLWFPTGGGKTEAYLGLIAFSIFFQRIQEKNQNQGVTVMMRYTLRMLNKQQFDRANILICSCEIIRSENKSLYGETRISNGLWVGGDFFPNKHEGSRDFPGNNELLRRFIDNIENKNQNNSKYSPPVFNCPCCGNKLVKEIVSQNDKADRLQGDWGYHRKIRKLKKKPFSHDEVSYNPFYLHCTNSSCHFYLSQEDFLVNNIESEKINNKCLPIYYVDEDIYEHRPTLLFSTVDKYAQLTWKNEAFRLFNLNEDFSRFSSPPCLIVQDELHLISSSLGTIYSLFEFVVDELSTVNGIGPKIVGATATVRNAKQQCIKIYNRKNYAQFPPVGIDIDDSFYSRKKKEDPEGRLYVGVMGSGNTSTTSKLRLDSLIYEGVNTLTEVSNKVLDNYYTLLSYFNTVKELGKYRTLLEDDMSAYRKFISKHLGNFYLPYNPDRITELSSQMSADQINSSLDTLENIRLQDIDTSSSIIQFLSSIGINSLRDLELSKYYKRRWFNIMSEYRLILKKICDIDDSLMLEMYPNNEKEEKDFEALLNEVFKTFGKELEQNITADIKDPIKVAMATNMIAVGVDIPRLNVMSISGQPKTTAEYIQASSRVGRQVPGIVFTLYNQAKNRDRSHYENFKDYHQAYYKYVESTSVTPFSIPALEKTIDSIVIALMKYYYFKNSSSAYLTEEAEKALHKIGSKLLLRYENIIQGTSIFSSEIDTRKKKEIQNLFDDVTKRWKDRGNVKFTSFKDIMGDPLKDENITSRLFLDAKYRDHHLTKGMLFAMVSLRDVDSSSEVKLKSYIN